MAGAAGAPAATAAGSHALAAPGQTRARLIAAARELIEEGGFANASVVAITSRAGLAAGTLYRHFGSKEELFVELLRDACEHELEAMAQAAARLAPGASESERVVELLLTFARRALRAPQLAWALLAEPVDERVERERLAYRARYRQLAARVLAAAIAAGELPEQDAELTAAALVGACGEALVGPLAPASIVARGAEQLLVELGAFVRRAIGAGA
jgi:AcrR family transcriptional regulator